MKDLHGHDFPAARYFYDEAFSRNYGWLTDLEQQVLRSKRVAMAGMGGVGGVHALSFARAGFADFHLSDFDCFELANFNRQVGALTRTIGRPKVEVIAEMVKEINPEAKVKVYPEGVFDGQANGHESNIEDFLDGVDIYIDGFDFFVLDVRKMVFDRCREKGIPVVCAAPIGMGSGYLVFMPDGMSSNDYFGFEGFDRNRKYVNFLLGLTPSMLQLKYLRDPSRVDFADKRGPSTGLSCQICASVATAEAIKILLKRGKVYPVPYYRHFDPYRSKMVISRIPFGSKNPKQRLKQWLAVKMLARFGGGSRPHEAAMPKDATPLMRVIEAARWTPSGDNTQPWRFETIGDDRVRVISDVAAGKNVYQYADSLPTKLALGMLVENMALEAGRFGMVVDYAAEERDGTLCLDVRLHRVEGPALDPLANFIPVRSVDRRGYRRNPLTLAQKEALARAAGARLELVWHEAASDRLAISALNAEGTNIRLTIPEAYPVHREIIDSSQAFSRTGIPDRALGLDPLTRKLMGWALGNYDRMRTLLRGMGGMLIAKAEMDYLPGLNCAAHVAVYPTPALDISNLDGLIEAGRGLQRFWLEVTRQGLAMQPELAVLCFSHYGRTGESFTGDAAMKARAGRLAADAAKRFAPRDVPLFLARVGEPTATVPSARSIRRPLAELMRVSQVEPS